jgi:hypothetical protein
VLGEQGQHTRGVRAELFAHAGVKAVVDVRER